MPTTPSLQRTGPAASRRRLAGLILLAGFLVTLLAGSLSLPAAPMSSIAFEEGFGTMPANSGYLGGEGTIVQQNLWPEFTDNIPVGTYAPAGNFYAVDFGPISAGEGNRAIDFPTSLGAMSGFTVCGWLNCRDLTVGSGGNRIAFALDASNGRGFDLVHLANGALQLGVNQWPDNTPAISSTGRLTADANTNAANWLFFAATYDSSLPFGQVKFYFGNADNPAALDVARDYSRGVIAASGSLTLGNFGTIIAARTDTANSRVFRGLMDEIKVFPMTLSAAQILSVQVNGTVPDPLPIIVSQPANAVIPMDGPATFTVLATGGAPLTYQWQLNGADILGANGSTYTAPSVSLSQSGEVYRVRVTSPAGDTWSAEASLTVFPIFSASYDFNTPGQYVNTPYNLGTNNWLHTALPSVWFEANSGGVSGSGAIDLLAGATENTSMLQEPVFDFSLDGKALVASSMFKVKAPSNNNRSTQMGFVTATNAFNGTTPIGVNDNNPQGFMTVILQSTAQPALTYTLRFQHRRTNGSIATQDNPTGRTSATVTLTAGNWYKITARFVNIKGTTADNFSIEATLQDMGADGATPGAVVQSFPANNVSNPDLVTQKFMYLAIRGFENTGVDLRDNIYAYANPGSVYVVVPPADQTVQQGQTATFKAMVDGEGPYTYQWQKSDGLGGYTNIPDAQVWKYITPPALLTDDNAQYRVQVTGPINTVTSDPATLTVPANDLAVVSAGCVDGLNVGVRFNQPVDAATALNPANYSINGLAPWQVELRPDRQSVSLAASAVLTGAFTVTVSGVQDLSGGNVGVANAASGNVANLNSVDVNNPLTPGETYSAKDGEFELIGNGNDIWGTADMFRYVYGQRSGNFDLRMQVPQQDVVRAPSKGAFVLREVLDPPSRMLFVEMNPMWPARQYVSTGKRDAFAASANNWNLATPAITYPNAWLRFRRVGNTFTAFTGTDGVNWTPFGQTTAVYPETVYLGVGACAVANVASTPHHVLIQNYGDFAGYPGATVALLADPTDANVGAGATATFTAAALATGVTNSEIAFQWQRSDGLGGWTNVPTANGYPNVGLNYAGATNSFVTPALTTDDNGAQFRCVAQVAGGGSAISAVATVTVTDTAAPTLTSVSAPFGAGYQVVLAFSEALSAAALDLGNFQVTNAAGAPISVTSAQFLGGDPRTVVLTTAALLELGNYGVVVNNVADLNGNVIAANTSSVFTQVAVAPAGPVVIDRFVGLPNTSVLTDLVYNVKYVQNTPDLVAYTNDFGINHVAGSLPDVINHYGARMYSYFVPPTSGSYKFWLRADDYAEFIMNTNTTGSTSPAMDVVTLTTSTSPANEQPYKAFDNNIYTKWLCNVGANAGAVITPTRSGSVVTGVRFTTANDADGRDPLTWTLEGADSPAGPWTVIASGNTGLPTTRLTTAAAVTFANATAYASYRVVFPTTRNASLNITQIAEIELLDAAGMDITGQDAVVRIVMTGANSAYGTGRAFTNTLVAGQRYYMEVRSKENTGGDGATVAVRTDNTTPGQGEIVPASMLDFPADIAPRTPVTVEFYTGLTGNTSAHQLDAYNAVSFVARTPNVMGYLRYFGYNTNGVQNNTTFDNYLGRMYGYFVPPSNGLYRFWTRSDDASQLFMNTNAVNSTDPAGMSLLGTHTQYLYAGAFSNIIQNVALVGGQPYYLEARWKDGTGGDFMAVAVRAQDDTATPPNTEVIPESMLEFAAPVSRVGAVSLVGLTPSDPTVAEGQQLTFSLVGLSGGVPYGYVWLKNGQVLQAANSPIYTTPVLRPSDDGATFTVIITNGWSTVSASSTVTVNTDSTPPALLSAVGSMGNHEVTLFFSEPMETTRASIPGNYQLSGGLGVVDISMDATRTQVKLVTTAQTPNTQYTVTVNNLQDEALVPNPLPADSQAAWTAWGLTPGYLLVEVWTNLTGGSVAELTNHVKFRTGAPDLTIPVNQFRWDSRVSWPPYFTSIGGNGLETYGARVSGWFNPPSNGVYRFFIRSDDTSQLFINTNEVNSADPAGRVLQAKADGANTAYTTAIQQSPYLPMVAGQSYYVEALVKEGTGGDFVTVAFRGDTSVPADAEYTLATFFSANLNPEQSGLTIVSTPPASLALVENDPFTLSVVATANVTIGYQWQTSDGLGGWVDVEGANAPVFTSYVDLAQNGQQVRVRVTVPGDVRNFPTTLNVSQDVTPPEIVSVNTIDGIHIGVRFNERVTDMSAGDEFNWYVGVAAPIQATLLPGGDAVLLELDPLDQVTGAFMVEATAICDRAVMENCADSSLSGTVDPLTGQDIGTPGTDPAYAGSTFTAKPGDYDVRAGGSDIWNQVDAMHMLYREVLGDFDIAVRVQSLTRPDTWTKAGLMARSSTNGNARTMNLLATPTTGQNTYTFQWRDADNFTSASARPGVAPASYVNDTPAYPNAWVRLQRTGSLFQGYIGTDGVNWTLFYDRDSATNGGWEFPDKLVVGLAVTAHLNNTTTNALAEFRDLYFPLPPTIVTQPFPANQAVAIHANVSYTVAGSTPPNTGTLAYQWKKDGVNIAGATSDTLTLNDVSTADAGVYTVAVGNDGGATVSDPVTLTVNNGLPVVVGETLLTTQNTPVTIPVAQLLANDSDPESEPLSILAYSGGAPGTFASDFNAGVPAGVTLYGTARVDETNGVSNSGVLKLTDPANDQSGVLLLDELTPQQAVKSFVARFKLLVGFGTSNPADGFSFNFANDLPEGTFGGAEEGTGTGLTVAFDNYDNGGGEAPAVDIKWAGTVVGHVLIPKLANPAFFDVFIKLDEDGTLDLSLGGRLLYDDLATGYTPITGRFGLAARAGGQNAAHWVDDLSISVLAAQTPKGGTFAISEGILTYTPATDTCGLDTIAYLVSDGQPDGVTVGLITIQVGEATPTPPEITACAAAVTVAADAQSCLAPVPDLTAQVVATDNCCCVDVTQNPLAGTLVPLGATTVVLTATDSAGLTDTCEAIVTVVDSTPPALTCPSPITLAADEVCPVPLPDLTLGAVVTDCLAVTVSQTPIAGTLVPPGPLTVTISAEDAAGNISTCDLLVTVTDTTLPTITCPADVTVQATLQPDTTCQGAIPNLAAQAVAADNCGSVIVTQDVAAGTLAGVGTTTVVTLTATDASNNTTTCMVNVTVADAAAVTITRQGNNVVITWPQTCTVAVLQEATSLASPITWTDSAIQGTLVGNVYQAEIPFDGTARFYSLRPPTP